MQVFIHKLQAFFHIQFVSMPLISISTIILAQSKIQENCKGNMTYDFGQIQTLNNDTHYI
jgi:hypothetical protein